MLRAYAALLATVVIWGLAPALIRFFSLLSSPQDAIVIRMLSVALLCACLLPFSGIYIARKHWPQLLLISCVGMFGYFAGSIFGFVYVTSGMGGLIMATQPLLIAVLAALIGTERMNLATIAGFTISFAGTLYLVSGDVAANDPSLSPWFGATLIAACSVAFAIYVVFSKTLVAAYGPFRVTNWVMVLAAVPALAFARPEALSTLLSLDLYAWASLIYLGPIGTIFATALWNLAVGKLPPTTVGAALYVVPLLSVLSGWLFLNEAISLKTMVAAAIILGGVALAEFGKNLKDWRDWVGVAALLVTVVAWGTVPLAMRFLLFDVSPQTAIFLRLYPAGIAAAIIAIWIGTPRMRLGEWMRIASAALLGNFAYQVLAAYGMQLIPSSWTGVLFGLEPIFIAIAAMLFIGEKLSPWFVAGAAIALIGTGVLVAGGSTGNLKDVSVLGVILVTLSTLGWAIYTTLIRPIAAQRGAVVTASLAVAIIALPTPAFLFPHGLAEIQKLTWVHWAAALHVGLIATTAATILWNIGLKTVSNSKAGMFLYAQPVIAGVLGVLLLGEEPSVWLLAGGALILVGVAVSQIRSPAMTAPQDDLEDESMPDEIGYRA